MVDWPADDHVRVAGSKRSAPRLAVVESSSRAEPPSARILPVGRITAFISMRGADIGGSACQGSVGAPRSIISGGGGARVLSPPTTIAAREAAGGGRGRRNRE